MNLNILGTLIFTFGLAMCGYTQDIYVATDGNNKNSGTKESPVASLEAARNLIRQYKAIKMLQKLETS